MDFFTIVTFIKEVLATLLILLNMTAAAPVNPEAVYQAENPDELIAGFAVISDVHVETNQPESYQNFNDILYGIKAGEDIDAVIYTGDNIMNGQLAEDFFFYSAIRTIKPSENNFVVSGNHDVGNGEGDYDFLRKKFLSNNALYLGNTLKTDYYYKVVNGCYAIVLASEDNTAQSFTMTEEQFIWLEDVLKQAQSEDAPVLVFNHFPIRYLSNHSPARLADLLKKYNCELFVHGHIHNDMGTDNFYSSYGIDCINLPRITEVHQYKAGDGIVIEVYEDEIVVRARDFIEGEWIDGLRYTY